MPRARYQLPLRILEIDPTNPTGPAKPVEAGKIVIEGDAVDAVLRKARGHLEGRGRAVRYLGMGQGEVVAVLHPPDVKVRPLKMRERDRRYK